MKQKDKLELLETIARIARTFILDARGSWDTSEGDYCIELIDKYNKEKENENSKKL